VFLTYFKCICTPVN